MIFIQELIIVQSNPCIQYDRVGGPARGGRKKIGQKNPVKMSYSLTGCLAIWLLLAQSSILY